MLIVSGEAHQAIINTVGKSTMPKHRFTVEVDADMTWTDTREFVHDALSSWGGQYFPGNNEQEGDPRFGIKEANVKVMRYTRPRTKPCP
jgi:hypothetical protein